MGTLCLGASPRGPGGHGDALFGSDSEGATGSHRDVLFGNL